MHLFAANGRRLIGVDRYVPALQKNRVLNSYTGLICEDLLDVTIDDKSADACIALDVIEHFTREDGERLLGIMERIARKRIVILTPNGFVPQAANENPWQEHKSGWSVDDFVRRGFQVRGIYGIKALRAEHSRLRFRPFWFWEPVSFLSQAIAAIWPDRAFALLACKAID